ncbi:ABC transporter permease [Mycoplasmopsis verecunda]|uniref:ABC-2 type transport system permease protein n=1 Tax=Mycoplasmopsis verecunda TaxID=171291 RepID=A0A1T4KFL4_9BACT|nr:ABC transporter permease [Mycoplasmopsis verecunda]WPB54886.1 ABC transporter permease [Mycoplasmopsis verecunda]SJZ41133.1 ABC-2 type transport system permease protein [Mycoplasmopsis verecunda]
MKVMSNYVSFLTKIIQKKKSTIIMPLFWIAIAIILSIVFTTFTIQPNVNDFIVYGVVFVELIITIFYASLKALHIYKDLEEEGVELLIYSKPISRRDIFIGKLIVFLLIGTLWSLIIMLCNLIIGMSIHFNYLLALTLLSFVVFIFAFILFGMFASIIGYKLNGKIALATPLVIFTPLVIGGTVISSQSTSTSDNMAYYLNAKRDLQPAGNKANVEMFYLNDNKDNFYIIPNGYDANKFSLNQINYINEAYKYSSSSSTEWQAYSWLITPYQMVDIFNFDNKNIFNSLSNDTASNLDNYLYYNHLDSSSYSYKLKDNNVMKKYQVNIGNLKNPQDTNAYLVPGALKNNVNATLGDQIINTSIIYVREGANDFNVSFPEDSYTNTTGSSLVGKLNWENIKQLLNSKVFNAYGKKFIQDIITSDKFKQPDQNDMPYFNDLILTEIQYEISNPDSMLNNLLDDNVIVLNDESIKNKLIKSKEEKQIYLLTALIYYIYFAYNGQLISDALLYNPTTNDYTPYSYSFKINNYSYNIGGYASYATKQQVENNKVIIRYDLKNSNNFLFQPVEQMYELARNNQIINKYGFIGIWITLGIILILINNILYIRKDYR